MPARSAPRATRLRSGHAGAAGKLARSPGGRQRPLPTCATAATRALWRSARSAGKPGPASGSPRAARSAATAGLALPGHASGADAPARSRRNGPPDRVESACTAGNKIHSGDDLGRPLVEELARLHNEFERVHPFIDGNG
ncbi:MAG: Fic family protein, partial [Streptosporangiaceae bacterium]